MVSCIRQQSVTIDVNIMRGVTTRAGMSSPTGRLLSRLNLSRPSRSV